MDAKLQLRVQRYGWDAAATHYHEAWQAQLAPAQDTLLRMAAPLLGQSVLEVAAGSGLVTIDLARAVGPNGHVLATDLSGKMVAQLSKRASAMNFDQITCKRMSAEQLETEESTFDHVVCALGLMYVPDPAQAMREMTRVLRPGGRLTVTVWGARSRCGWAEIFPIVDREVASDVCPMFFATGSGDILSQMAQAQGLTQIVSKRQEEKLYFKSARDVIRAVIDGGPVALAVKRFSESARNRVEAAFMESIDAFMQPDSSYRIPGEFLTVSATRPETQ
ncbi:class I SAM-dependent methyltransferase [Sedimentitalea sp.]|uniref:class I SAM-dependent methyltransferase n=1 Tax=Sedimentitalea sp. TaxID=2048915 RepID=UPI0032975C02